MFHLPTVSPTPVDFDTNPDGLIAELVMRQYRPQSARVFKVVRGMQGGLYCAAPGRPHVLYRLDTTTFEALMKRAQKRTNMSSIVRDASIVSAIAVMDGFATVLLGRIHVVPK